MFQRVQIALALRCRPISLAFEKFTNASFLQNANHIITYVTYKNRMHCCAANS